MAEIWDKLPGESQKAWTAFKRYREMPITSPVDGEQRSLSNLATKMGYAGTQLLQKWSAKFNWVERANAYVERKDETALAIREVALGEYQQKVIESLTGNLSRLDAILSKRLEHLLKNADEVDGRELQRITAAIKTKDDLARRAAGMPVTFREETADEQEYEAREYTIGDDV
jgi:hypothetical protein